MKKKKVFKPRCEGQAQMCVRRCICALIHSYARHGDSNPRGLPRDGVCTSRGEGRRLQMLQPVPVLNDRRRAVPGTSGKSSDLKEPQGLSPKQFGMEMSQSDQVL